MEAKSFELIDLEEEGDTAEADDDDDDSAFFLFGRR